MQLKRINMTERAKNRIIIILATLVLASVLINIIISNSGTEVEAEYVGPGTISQTLRGSGSVLSNANIEVLSESSCVIYSVPVNEGDTVNAGDVLCKCSHVSAEEAENLKNEIDDLLVQYKQSLIDKSGGRYTEELAAIERAQNKLDEAKARCAALVVSDEDLIAAKNNVTRLENEVIAKEDQIAQLEALGGGSAIPLEQAQAELDAIMIVYGEGYGIITAKADELMEKAGYETPAEKDENREKYLVLAVYEQKEYIKKLREDAGTNIPMDVQKKIDKAQDSIDSFNKVKPAQDKVKAAQQQTGLLAARQELINLNREKTNAENHLEKLKAKRQDWETANSGLESLRKTVDTATEALATTQKAGQKEDLQLSADEQIINTKRAELEELTNGGQPTEILSKVHGIVTSISITPGNSVTAGTVIMTLEAPDMGYALSIPVSLEQSKLVSPGESGSVTQGFEPTEICAILTEIKNDPDTPGYGKLLVFELSGDVDSGMELNVSVSKPDEDHALVVPLSTLREDSQGCYVLRVLEKRGLFGTRYFIDRVSVKVLSRDDENAAVSGDIFPGDMVVTTYQLKLKAGDTIRLTD